MLDEQIAVLRSFNRTVSQRVGALNDRYLARERPLGEARMLWEIGPEGCDLRSLRSRLDLDSGYASRLLRSLEAAGLAASEPAPGDRRIRRVTLTRQGLRERRILDQRSDELARGMLDPLSDEQRTRLAGAMAVVDRLLTLSSVTVATADPETPLARYCLRAYFEELAARFDRGFDPAQSISAEPEELRPPAGLFLVAELHGEAVGCGALKFHQDGPTEIKRMWVAPSARGIGLGRRLLAELERAAVRHAGPPCLVRLDTNRALVEAIAMYRSTGYREVPAFNDEPYADHWFEKRVGS